MKRAAFFLGALLLASAFSGHARTLLFVDDHEILYRSGTERVAVPLQRSSANPVIKGREKPWEVAIAWTSVYRNPKTGRYQLWYQAYAGEEARDKTRRCVVSYAESEDGLHFTKPNLGLFDFNGSKETSIVLIANGGTSDRYGVSVVVDEREKNPERRYKMAHFDFSKDGGPEMPGLNVAFSADGIHWEKHGGGTLSPASYGNYGEPVPFIDETNRPWSRPLSMADALDAFYDPARDVFAIYGKMWIDGPDGSMYWKHAAGRIESKDFLHWSQPELVATPDEQDAPCVEFHTMPVFFYEGCYFSPLQILNRAVQGGIVDVELALSRDGFHWQRPFRKPFWIEHSPQKGGFDSGAIFVSPQPVVLNDEMRFYYGGYSQGATGSDDQKLTTGIGLATLPRDRFAGLRPVAVSDQPTLKMPLKDIGQFTLKPFDFSGVKQITLNADASIGSIRVEVLDESGKRLRGFSKDDAVPIEGDSLRHLVTWKDHRISELAGKRCLLRFHLNNATAYALTLSQ